MLLWSWFCVGRCGLLRLSMFWHQAMALIFDYGIWICRRMNIFTDPRWAIKLSWFACFNYSGINFILYSFLKFVTHRRFIRNRIVQISIFDCFLLSKVNLIFNRRMWLSVLIIVFRNRCYILFNFPLAYHLRPPLFLPPPRYLICHRQLIRPILPLP